MEEQYDLDDVDHSETDASIQTSSRGVLPVEESTEKTVSQLTPTRLRWDLSDLDDDILESAWLLEIVWYLEDHPPWYHRLDTDRRFEYEGLVAFDDIRLTDDKSESESAASRTKQRKLHRNHGAVVNRTLEEHGEDFEAGTVEFADGAEVSYTFEVLGDGQFRYTIDGEAFDLGGEVND
ncbi:hypothetical protein [Salinadaptatus halalkaliphilus]|uniref:hypothetical protein n=1 Tax=Salinadaptatus halalkaliphilus TaxID=2419781 RepID=UPI001144A073|nr:hypothetical protein [Salinadaptatus halalkaliphilus]